MPLPRLVLPDPCNTVQDTLYLCVGRADEREEIFNGNDAVLRQPEILSRELFKKKPDNFKLVPGYRLIYVYAVAIDSVAPEHVFHGLQADAEFFADMLFIGLRVN